MSREFNARDYAFLNPDLRQNRVVSDSSLRRHWLQFGQHENRNALHPDTWFKYKEYLELNPDLVKAGIVTEVDALNHWYRHGKQERRKTRRRASAPVFPKTRKSIVQESKYPSICLYPNKIIITCK